MKKRIILAVIMLLLIPLLACCQQAEKADAYADNTGILTNPAAPKAGEPDIGAIEGYTEAIPEGLTLPYSVPDTYLEIVSVGGYTGVYPEDTSGDSCTDIPAIVVRNTGDKVVSYASLTVRYGDKEEQTAVFMPTNIPAGCCDVVCAGDKKLSVEDFRQFSVVEKMQIVNLSLPLIEGEVGVSYEDGYFIVTNLKDEAIGEVYIRYKYISDGNAYLGGATFSVNTAPLDAHMTQKLAVRFDPEQSAILAVERL